jgi:hypothetical protein
MRPASRGCSSWLRTNPWERWHCRIASRRAKLRPLRSRPRLQLALFSQISACNAASTHHSCLCLPPGPLPDQLPSGCTTPSLQITSHQRRLPAHHAPLRARVSAAARAACCEHAGECSWVQVQHATHRAPRNVCVNTHTQLRGLGAFELRAKPKWNSINVP